MCGWLVTITPSPLPANHCLGTGMPNRCLSTICPIFNFYYKWIFLLRTFLLWSYSHAWPCILHFA